MSEHSGTVGASGPDRHETGPAHRQGGMLSLDTHMVVALLDGSLKKAEERRIVSEEIAISGIVLWERVNAD